MEDRLLTKLACQLQSVMSMQNEQTEIPNKKGKRRGASSKEHSNGRQFQSFEAEPSQPNLWIFDDGPTYIQSDYSKKYQWQPNSSRRYQQYQGEPQCHSNHPPRHYQNHQDQHQWQSDRHSQHINITTTNPSVSLIVIVIGFNNIGTNSSTMKHLEHSKDSILHQIVTPFTMVYQHLVSVHIAVLIIVTLKNVEQMGINLAFVFA